MKNHVEVVLSVMWTTIASTSTDVSIFEHGWQNIPSLEGLLCREATNKVTSTSAIETCYKNIMDIHFIHASANHPSNAPWYKDSNLPPLILIQPFEHCLSAQKLGNIGILQWDYCDKK